MALTIRDAETSDLVRRYATIRGVSVTRAVRDAVAAALGGDGAPSPLPAAAQTGDANDFAERLRRAQQAFKPFAGKAVDADAIIGYNEYGVPE